jgi:uracil phosphoribosyltransferase
VSNNSGAGKVVTVSHPLVQHKLTIMRDRSTNSQLFRTLVKEVGMLIAYEVTRDLALTTRSIETPLQTMVAPTLANENLVLVSILRAGNGLLDGVLELMPSARVGFLGLYRDPKTLQPVEYYCKMPSTISSADVFVLDPMLATGHSAAAAVTKIKTFKPRSIRVVNLLAAPEGVNALHAAHPDIDVFVGAVDERLNDHGYIVPGLGDAGDRLFGTK